MAAALYLVLLLACIFAGCCAVAKPTGMCLGCSRLLIGSCSRCVQDTHKKEKKKKKGKKRKKRNEMRLDRTSALRDPPTCMVLFFSSFLFFTFYFYSSHFMRHSRPLLLSRWQARVAIQLTRVPCIVPESILLRLMSV